MNYKRFLYGGNLIVSLLINSFIYTQAYSVPDQSTPEVDFRFASGSGLFEPNKFQLDNILFNIETRRPFDGLYEWKWLPYQVVLTACINPEGQYFLKSTFEQATDCQDSSLLDFSQSQLTTIINNDRLIISNIQQQDDPLALQKTMIFRYEPFNLAESWDPIEWLGPIRQITIELEWANNSWLELDAHLTGNTENNPDARFHLYSENLHPSGVIAQLNWQNELGERLEQPPFFEPSHEIATVNNPVWGVYRFSVYNWGGGNIADPEANVKVRLKVYGWGGNEAEPRLELLFMPRRPKDYWVAEARGSVWTVFEALVDARGITVWPKQEYATNYSPGDIRKGEREK